jgi:mannobiose 2-epimerase
MNISDRTVAVFGRRAERLWHSTIAPFWLTHAVDLKHGGFHGWITNDLQVDEQAEKGIILNSRILWTFSEAAVRFDDPRYKEAAQRAYQYLTSHFFDEQAGGVYWTVDYTGKPSDKKKRVYAQAFAIYALTAYFSVNREREAINQALELFYLLESYCRDREHDGYFETFERDWTLATDQRLSEVDQDEKKSMNAHLHILEAYTALARTTWNEQVRERLRALVELFIGRIVQTREVRVESGVDTEWYLGMFFDEQWRVQSDRRSFGHDIEASWLLTEAGKELKIPELSVRLREVSLNLARSVYDRGLDGGSLFYEADPRGIVDDEKHWWVQTETVVGFVNAWELTNDQRFLWAAIRVLLFIQNHLVDKEHGEWFWKTSRDGKPVLDMPKLSQWKCPYHNGRMCFEVSWRFHPSIRRLRRRDSS